MSAWSEDELNRLGRAEELRLASVRQAGDLRNPVTVWIVREGNNLYVRSWRGKNGAWYRQAQVCMAGCIWGGGIEKDVIFVAEQDPAVNDQVDRAYREKYGRYRSYAEAMTAPPARMTTLKLIPK